VGGGEGRTKKKKHLLQKGVVLLVPREGSRSKKGDRVDTTVEPESQSQDAIGDRLNLRKAEKER